MNKCNVHEVYRCTVLCTRLCASRRGSVQVDLAGYKRGSLSRHPVWVIACFLQPPPPSFLPLRSLFLRSLQVTRRDMEIIWRIIIVLDQMRLISTPRAKRIRSRESRICESCAASGSQVCYYQRVMKIFFIFVVRVEDRFLCVYFFEKKKRILRNKFFFFFFKFVEVIAKK